MSPKKRQPLHIALPPRISLSLSRTNSSESAPNSSSPHTPLPYEFAFTPELAAQHASNGMHFDELEVSSAAGSKRARDEEEERAEPEWTDEEMDVLQSTLMHPFRPLSVHYPPGELPPPNAIDELTTQILNFAFRSSPTTHMHEGWLHAWNATRRKLFKLALAESKFGGDVVERKERATRPGLRRVDSMDFLDQEPEEGGCDKLGRALRLSTSLQNSAKQDPVLVSISRSTSLNSALCSDSTPAGPSSPPVTTVTVTPSPPPPNLSASTRRRGSFRSSQSRPVRPASLLQRGRSFTASDLRAEVEAQNTPIEETVIEESPKSDDEKMNFSTSPDTLLPIDSNIPPRISPQLHTAPRITRSYSSSSALPTDAHAARNAFLSPPKPSSTDLATLAMPLPLCQPEPTSSSGWSDSEDDASAKPKRAVKKVKGGRPRPKIVTPLAEIVRGEQLLLGGGLRSPFEEKTELQF